jgi:hypothetical protein
LKFENFVERVQFVVFLNIGRKLLNFINIVLIEKLTFVMPPKSAKKEQKSLWHTCDKCNLKIIQSKLKLHDKDCNSPVDGIDNETFNKSSLTYSLPPEIDAKDSPTLYLQRFLFVPEAVCSLCNFTMGCNLLIDVNGRKYVRSSWTIGDKYLDETFSNSDGKKTLIFVTNY